MGVVIPKKYLLLGMRYVEEIEPLTLIKRTQRKNVKEARGRGYEDAFLLVTQ